MARTTYVVQITKGTAQPPDRAWRPSLASPTVYIGSSTRQIEAAQNAAIVALNAAGIAVHASGALHTAGGTPIGYAIVTVAKAGM